MTLYHLAFLARESENGFRDSFFIGVFPSREEAEKTAQMYLAAVPGFREDRCSYTIEAKEVRGGPVLEDTVYWIQGWNWNEAQDEADIVESGDYARLADAEAALKDMKRWLDRAEWTLNRSVIGRCDWREGYSREENEGPVGKKTLF